MSLLKKRGSKKERTLHAQTTMGQKQAEKLTYLQIQVSYEKARVIQRVELRA